MSLYQRSRMLTHRAVDHLEFSMPSQRLDENSRTEPPVIKNDRWYQASGAGGATVAKLDRSFFGRSVGRVSPVTR